MHPSVETARPEIRTLCRRLGVRSLDLFGSASGPDPAGHPADVDVLVVFGALPAGRRFDAYFQLKEGLEEILGMRVDVVAEQRDG